jgi:hypothetical protein
MPAINVIPPPRTLDLQFSERFYFCSVCSHAECRRAALEIAAKDSRISALEAKMREMAEAHQAANARVTRVRFRAFTIAALLTLCAYLLPHSCDIFTMPTALNRALQAKADLQRSNDARDTLEQAVEEMKRELIAAASSSMERSVLQDEVAAFCANQFSRPLTRLRSSHCKAD